MGNLYKKIILEIHIKSLHGITNRDISLESHWKGVTLQMAVVVGCHFVFNVRKSYKMLSFGNVHQMAGDVLFVLKKSENHLALLHIIMGEHYLNYDHS